MRSSIGRRLRSSDEGSAVVEFVVAAVCILVPLVYAVAAIASVQSATFASTQAVREAGRAFSLSASQTAGRAAAVGAARLAFADHGLDLPTDALTISCPSGACLSPGSIVQVDLDWNVPLPWLPDLFDATASVPLSATHRVPIDEYRSGPSEP